MSSIERSEELQIYFYLYIYIQDVDQKVRVVRIGCWKVNCNNYCLVRKVIVERSSNMYSGFKMDIILCLVKYIF